MAISKIKPSASTNGRPIKVAATATAGTAFHAAHATALDELYMFLTNTDTVERQVTIEFGGVTSPDDLIKVKVPPGETVLAIPGVPVTGSVTVAAFCDAANVVNMFGYVNRISG